MTEKETIGTATYSPEDNKIRIYPFARLDSATYARVKAAGYKWAPKQELFVAPMWTPEREDLALELCGDIEDEDKSLVERQEERAERFEDYSAKRADDSTRAHAAVQEICDGIPLGQPILVGHHSERHARKQAARIENGMRKALKLFDQSKYWQQRAAGALRHAKYKELPRVRANRIKTIEADKRKFERNRAAAEKGLAIWTKEGLTLDDARKIAGFTEYGHLPCCKSEFSYWSAYNVLAPDDKRYKACPAWTLEMVQDRARKSYPHTIAHCDRWIAHFKNRLIYEKAMLDEQGESDLIAPKARPKQLPICNYKAPGGITLENVYKRGTTEHYPQVEMTAAEYKAIYDDYKGTRTVENSHRVRIALIKKDGGQFYDRLHVCVFISDSKAHSKPEAIEKNPVIFDAPAIPQYRAPKEETEQEKEMQAMRETLKTGVQTVSAPQLFPTPPEIAEQMIEAADIQPGHDLLEPSAGTGNLLKALPCIRPNGAITAVEINYTLSKALEPWADNIVCGDFLEHNGDLGKFDRIIMNPPFENGSDIKHIKHAIKFLKPNGRLVALCANGPRQQEQLKPLADSWKVLPEGSFKNSGTMVNVAMMVINN